MRNSNMTNININLPAVEPAISEESFNEFVMTFEETDIQDKVKRMNQKLGIFLCGPEPPGLK